MTASSDLGSGARRGAVSDVEQGNDQDENLRTTRQRITHQENKIKEQRIEIYQRKAKILQLERELRGAKEKREGSDRGYGAGTGTLPDFIIIGANKAGTSSLYYLLTKHPYVKRAAAKELNFFDIYFDRGVEWYRWCFPAPRWKNGRRTITGEASPRYLFHPYAAKRMAEVVPQVRLIALLRNPVDKAYSDYQQATNRDEKLARSKKP
jgi:hypothetical protein